MFAEFLSNHPIDFAFVCIDQRTDGDSPRQDAVYRAVTEAGVPFIDSGVSITLDDCAVRGAVTTSAYDACSDAWEDAIPNARLEGGAPGYRNVQLPEVNAAAATFAVMEWRRRTGQYVSETLRSTRSSGSRRGAPIMRSGLRELPAVKLRPIFVEVMPSFDAIKDGQLWISHKHRTVNLRCPCGCGELTVLSLHPSRWHVYFDGKSVSLKGPTRGSIWTTSACGSHYFIRNNEVVWSYPIDPGRRADYEDAERARMLGSTPSRQTLRSRLGRVWRGLSIGKWRR